MSWNSLPDDVVEVLVAKLSLVDLARVSTTCRTFQAVYRRQLAREHEARCRLANDYLGHEVIIRITSAIILLLTAESLDLTVNDDGFHVDFVPDNVTYNPRAVAIAVYLNGLLAGLRVPTDVKQGYPTWRELGIYLPWGREGVGISHCPWDDGDVEMVALVQAVLSGGLAQYLRDEGEWAQIDISRSWPVVGSLNMSRREVLKTQIAPLMQFASRCKSMKPTFLMDLRGPNELQGSKVYLVERMHIRRVSPAAEKEKVAQHGGGGGLPCLGIDEGLGPLFALQTMKMLGCWPRCKTS